MQEDKRNLPKKRKITDEDIKDAAEHVRMTKRILEKKRLANLVCKTCKSESFIIYVTETGIQAVCSNKCEGIVVEIEDVDLSGWRYN